MCRTVFRCAKQIDRLVEARTLNYDVKQFFEEFQGLRLAAAPINPPSAFLADEQTQHRNYLATVDHVHLGSHQFPGDPYHFSESPWRIERGAPLLGEHQIEIDAALARPSGWLGARAGDALPATGKSLFEGIRVVSFPTGIVGPALARPARRAWRGSYFHRARRGGRPPAHAEVPTRRGAGRLSRSQTHRDQHEGSRWRGRWHTG